MLSAGTGGGRGLLGWRWSAAVVMEWLGTSLCAVMATAELRELGGYCGEEERPEKRSEGAEWLGQKLAGLRPRPGASWPARTECWRRAAVAGDTRRQCSVPVGHCTFAIQLIQTSSAMSDSVFSNRFNC